MSDMKCPFCNKKLEPIGTSGQFQCGTWGCDASFNFIATRDVWEYIECTRKALDIATGFIKGISQTAINDCDNQYVVLGNFKKFAKDTLEEITALEQKDVK